jgi:hypothetical protein
MSEAKAPKKDTAKIKKSKKKEPKLTPESSIVPEAGSVDKATDKATDKVKDKAAAAPKSASQSSISHFSSVATEEYRSGWADIFGGKKQKNS